MTAYFDNLCTAMSLCAEHPRAIFLGQAVVSPGTAMHATLQHIPLEKRLELPVAENMQMGMSTGIALGGGLPISIFPRINFLLEAVPQLVQHLDKLPLYSNGGYRPKVIIRTAVAAARPLNPGPQHLGDYSYALSRMLSTVTVEKLNRAADILPAYRAALERVGSTLLIELTEQYN
jgi:pyruvate/2-oxoglutarate/acetoin dehydrogenase E1 component